MNSLNYQVVTKINRRSRRISIKIKSQEMVELIVPNELHIKSAMQFFQTKRIWVENNLLKLSKLVDKFEIEIGKAIPVWGQLKTINTEDTNFTYIRDKDFIIPEKFSKLVKFEVRQFLKKELASYLSIRVNELANQMNLQFKNFKIKDTKSRWGSCAHDGELTFAFRLIFMSKDIVDYVIIHELAHLQHMNHSKHFWQLVEKYCKKYKQLRNSLKRAPQVQI